MPDQNFNKSGNKSIFPDMRSKKGNARGLTVALVAIAATLVVALVIGAASVFLLINRNSRRSSNDSAVITDSQQEVTMPTVQEPEKKENTKSSSDHPVTDSAETLAVNSAGEDLTYAEIFKKVNPATVSIYAQVTQTGFWGGTETGEATGSGFLISADGYIVTNAHVISGSTAVQVQIPGYEDRLDAEIIGQDVNTDIAILKLNEKKDFSFVEMGSSGDVVVGEEVVAIGNPLGQLSGSITNGIISSRDREVEIDGTTYNLFQTNAEINPGNSGGPLLNMKGQVIGVTNAKASASEGIGFAIPIDDIQPVIKDLMTVGYVTGRPFVGIHTQPIDEYMAAQLEAVPGLYIMNITKGSPADKAGLLKGDVIIGVNDTEIESQKHLTSIRDEHEVGDTMVFHVFRNGEEIEIPVVLEEYAPEK